MTVRINFPPAQISSALLAILKSHTAASGLVGPPGLPHKGRFPGNPVDLCRALRLPPRWAGSVRHSISDTLLPLSF